MDLLEAYQATLPFELDAFQREAIEKLDRGRGGVLVSAPTSSGKTVVADYVDLAPLEAPEALRRPSDAAADVLYTTPLKALSNQKYHDLVRALRRAPASASSPARTPSTTAHRSS